MQYALVTGASGGIGKAISIKLAQMGYHVLIHYFSNETAALETFKAVQDAGSQGTLIQFDAGNFQEVKSALDSWKQSHPESYISVLVNNAGTSKDMLLVWMEEQDWHQVINTNLNSFYFVTSQLVKDMVIKKFGRIVNLVSLSGIKGLPGQTNYSAAKAGVIGATKALAQEVGRKNVTVNAVAPGYIRTEMTKNLDETELKKPIPMNRFGTPEEVAETVGFLVSNGASYITGEVINVNGGLYT